MSMDIDVHNGPLYLSKYLADGKIEEAHKASQVILPHSSIDVSSWSGYITVNVDRGDHLFVWYFPRTNETEKTIDKSPLVVWLNGGPGFSSLLGLFEEIGPFVVDDANRVCKRQVSWTDHFSLLFIDNPVGTGFSYRESSSRPCNDDNMSLDEIISNLHECITQFFEIFPQVKAQDVYIGGQSFAGKYIPPLACKLHTTANPNIRLKGVYIGSGLMSPETMLPLTPVSLVTLGVISKNSGMRMRSNIVTVIEEMKANPQKATIVHKLMECIFGYMAKVKGYPCMDNMISTQDYNWRFASYLNLPEVQQAIHAKPCEFQIMNENAIGQMASDFLVGMEDEISTILEHYRVLIFNGQMDPVVNVPMTDAFLSDLQWSGSEEFACAVKGLWKDASGNVAGYGTTVRNLTWLIISRSGHRTAIDQPVQVLEMMQQFVKNSLSF